LRQLLHHEAERDQQPRFGRADEQDAARFQQAPQRRHHAFLRGAIEVNEQIAAEHDVVQRRAGQEIRRQDVRL
jgi:hypothetical protein